MATGSTFPKQLRFVGHIGSEEAFDVLDRYPSSVVGNGNSAVVTIYGYIDLTFLYCADPNGFFDFVYGVLNWLGEDVGGVVVTANDISYTLLYCRSDKLGVFDVQRIKLLCQCFFFLSMSHLRRQSSQLNCNATGPVHFGLASSTCKLGPWADPSPRN